MVICARGTLISCECVFNACGMIGNSIVSVITCVRGLFVPDMDASFFENRIVHTER